MAVVVYVISALALPVAAFVVFRIVVRRDYLRHKRLTLTASLLQLLLWAVYILGFPSLYNLPTGCRSG